MAVGRRACIVDMDATALGSARYGNRKDVRDDGRRDS